MFKYINKLFILLIISCYFNWLQCQFGSYAEPRCKDAACLLNESIGLRSSNEWIASSEKTKFSSTTGKYSNQQSNLYGNYPIYPN